MVDQEEIHRKCNSVDSKERGKAVNQLCNSFGYLYDQEQAWKDLIKLTSDQENDVRLSAVKALRTVFKNMLDKQQAWKDIIKLTENKERDVRWWAAEPLRNFIKYVPDRQQAWRDLIKLTENLDINVRLWAVKALGIAFKDVPDKQQAWKDLHKLTSDKNSVVRAWAVKALGIAFKDVPDKQQAWKDLHKFTSDKDSVVRNRAAEALGTVFVYVPDKQQAWKDLIKLTSDKTNFVRVNAYHSLGRISIYKASQSKSEEAYLEELKKAIEFFENAAKEPIGNNPSKFCFPFYRSFYAIISTKKREAKDEVDKYLSEAKIEIGRSKNKKLLLEAVNNLANALKEVQSLENMNLEAKKGELNFYRKYCEQAAELMKDTEENAPYATATIIKGLPILDRNLKSLLEEIQEKADTACQISKGPAKKVACAVKEEVQRWEISNQEEMTFCAKNLYRALKLIIPHIPENEFIHNEIDKALAEKDLVNLFTITSTFIGSIPTLKMVSDKLNNLEKLVIEVNSKVDELIIISKPGISEEFVISSGIQLPGLSAEHVVTIPLREISYSELKEDLERIKGKSIEKLSQLPTRLSEKVKSYLMKIGRKDVLEKLTN